MEGFLSSFHETKLIASPWADKQIYDIEEVHGFRER